MRKPGKGEPKRVSQAEIGRLLGASRKAVSDWGAKPSFPAPVEGAYAIFDVVMWWLTDHAKVIDREFIATELSGGDPLLLGGGDSPGLERFRNARAELAEMEVRQRRGELLDRSVMLDVFGRVTSVLRGATQTLRREFGNEAYAIVNDALQDARRSLGDYFRELEHGTPDVAGGEMEDGAGI